MNYTALILAAGQGTRMNLGYNKMFYEIEKGKTILDKTLAIFQNDEQCKQIILVMNEEDVTSVAKKIKWSQSILIIRGGTTRQESVFNGLKGVGEEVVLIHDGARCYLNQKSIDDCLNALESKKACLLMVPCKDTIKEVENGKVRKTLDRSILYQAQTPQAFKTDLIFECYCKAMGENYHATDDAQIVEKYSDEEVVLVLGDYSNIKVTTLEDLQ